MRNLLASIRQFFAELRRRKVYRVALAYLAAGFVVVELADIAAGAFRLPPWFGPMVWVLCGLGFPIALVLAWAFEVVPEAERHRAPTGTAPEQSADKPESSTAEAPRGSEAETAPIPEVRRGAPVY
jgi:hypothetical protein